MKNVKLTRLKVLKQIEDVFCHPLFVKPNIKEESCESV